MHHKTSDSVEIQENEFPENARKKKKIIFSIFQNRTNADEIQKIKPLVFRSMIFFLCGRIRTNLFWDFPKFRKIGKIAEK